MRWLAGVVSAIVVLALLPGAGAQAAPHRAADGGGDPPLYIGEVSAEEQIDDSGGGCGSHTHYSWSASKLQSDAFGGSGFELVNGGAAHALGESGSGTVVHDPCGDTPGCSDTLTLVPGPGDGVDFGLEGGSLVVNVGFTGWAESGSCGVPFQYPGTALTSGHIPLSAIGSPTITVDLSSTTASPDGEKVSRGSGTLTLHRVDSVLKGDELAAPHATLLTTDVWRATLHNPIATAKSYRWEMQPSSARGWTTLDTTKSSTYKITYRLAGNFKLRVWFLGASAGGPPKDLVSPVRPVEVRFPSWDDIVADKEVAKFTRAAWAHTLVLAKLKWRQEVGFWISLRTCSGTYGHTTRIEGPRAGPNDRARIILGPRPADTTSKPDPVKGCYTYMVAAFHTHTPTTFLSRGRKVGPSPEDRQVNIGRKMPAVILDYIASPPGSGHIPAGWPKPKPAKPYWAGFFRRPTP